nr:TetR/AcrR family transcriptional regulator [Nocardia nova]
MLAAAQELVFKRGFRGVTIAEIADRAHVGKGTVYLYWSTKEDLFHGLFARDFLAMLDEYVDMLTADPDLCRPHRLFPRLVTGALTHPFVRALHTRDSDLLGVLAEHPRSRDMFATLGPGALMHMVLPVWRRHRLARTDWPLDRQAYALRALMTGFLDSETTTPPAESGLPQEERSDAMSAAVTALLGPEAAGPDDIRATADEGLRLLHEAREAILASITPDRK